MRTLFFRYRSFIKNLPLWQYMILIMAAMAAMVGGALLATTFYISPMEIALEVLVDHSLCWRIYANCLVMGLPVVIGLRLNDEYRLAKGLRPWGGWLSI